MKKVTLEYAKGTRSGSAIYLMTDELGTRIAGPKCWGFVKTVDSFELTKSDLEHLIDAAKQVLKEMKK